MSHIKIYGVWFLVDRSLAGFSAVSLHCEVVPLLIPLILSKTPYLYAVHAFEAFLNKMDVRILEGGVGYFFCHVTMIDQ